MRGEMTDAELFMMLGSLGAATGHRDTFRAELVKACREDDTTASYVQLVRNNLEAILKEAGR